MYCDICTARFPDAIVNAFEKEDKYGSCELCALCQFDLDKIKNRKCKCCGKKLKKLSDAVKLFYLDKSFYFCNHKCYYKYVDLKHSTSKIAWDNQFNKLSAKQKKIYVTNLKRVKNIIAVLHKDYNTDFLDTKIKHAYVWMRPKY